MYILLSWLTVLLALFGSNNGQQQECRFDQLMTPGMTYYIANTGYPGLYSRGSSCQWIAKSVGRIKLTCQPFHVPASLQCKLDSLIVQDGQEIGLRYCGDNGFTIISEFKQLTLTLVATPFSPGGWFRCALETACECGKRNPMRIVGGTETGVNEYPMMAAVINVHTSSVHCGATIINAKQVLTAAHCVFGRNKYNTGVLVGDHNLTTGADTKASVLHKIDFIDIHEGYNSDTLNYDIALITVIDTIKFNHDVGPVCLPFQRRTKTFVGDFVDVLGWGASHFADGPLKILMKASMGVISNEQCQRYYPKMTYTQMCIQERHKDSCQYDSGGPLLWQSPSSRRVIQVGIISSGSICDDGIPAQNTRIGPLLDWILLKTYPEIYYCQVE